MINRAGAAETTSEMDEMQESPMVPKGRHLGIEARDEELMTGDRGTVVEPKYKSRDGIGYEDKHLRSRDRDCPDCYGCSGCSGRLSGGT